MERGMSRPSPATRRSTKTGVVPSALASTPDSSITESGHSLMEKSSSSPKLMEPEPIV